MLLSEDVAKIVEYCSALKARRLEAALVSAAGRSAAQPMCLHSICDDAHHYKRTKLCPLICIYASRRNRERN